ncbi:MAG: 50S ribosomal protein L25 [Planctomycetes bacterium]|uniref:50S ribosomal protein L25 n=1 Tax=Candidatus Wunengus californicus TaxID=3367619 RepID=UPI00402676BB|nr:50S ribosomal protein L25 [Planctomycetota bacterium]MBI4221881.1 50S ribosomal protein L25 [Planctomycetota bacterium]
MKILELKAEKRTTRGSKAVKKLRESGQIPAILYGHKPDNVMLCLNEHDFTRILHSGTRMINLTVDNKKESALIKDVQYDNLLDRVLHVDFSRIDLTERVKLRVPLEVHGEPVGVKEGGVLTHVMKDVEIECLPTAIPEKIKVNISELGMGKAIHVKELPVLEGIQYISETELVVASVHQIVEAKAVSEEELLAEPEVITKKPKEGEEESAEAAKKT